MPDNINIVLSIMKTRQLI